MGVGSGGPYRFGEPVRLARPEFLQDSYSEEEGEEIEQIFIDYTPLFHSQKYSSLLPILRRMEKYPQIFEKEIEDIYSKKIP